MTNEECFTKWAPDGVAWAAWAKPVLFAHLNELVETAPPAEDVGTRDVAWLPGPDRHTALIVDLPGAEAVWTGLALARTGYRPVPVFNGNYAARAEVPVEDTMHALRAAASVFPSTGIAMDAPPAFLIDSRRMALAVPLSPGVFDNRWIVLPQDFPSVVFLRTHAVSEVVLVQRGGQYPPDDLAHVLLRWQQGGVTVRRADLETRSAPDALLLQTPSMFRRAWYRAIAVMGLRRDNTGGFGAVIPDPSSGGGFYG